MNFNNERKFSRPPLPRCRPSIKEFAKYNNSIYVPSCRPSIKEIAKHNNNNTINMPSDIDSSTIKEKVRRNEPWEVGYNYNACNSTTNSHSDYDSTDSESSIDDAPRINLSNRSRGDNNNVRKNSGDVEDSNSLHPFLLISIIISLVIPIGLYALNSYFHVSQNNRSDQLMQNLYESKREIIQELHQSVGNIQLKFKNQKFGTWNAFLSQVEEVINESTQISMIILLGNETNTVTCLAHLLGSISTKALGSDNYSTLNARNLGNDHGEIIDKLKAEIWINRVAIVEDLLTMNSEAIKVFHNLCDKENPLISKAVYIITIVSSGYKGSHEDKFVEDRLTAKFSKAIDIDILNPLITRIMDGPIISILPEPSLKGKKTLEECLLF